MAEKSYRPWSPRQPYLLPPSLMEWLPPKHLAYFVLDVVEQLNLVEIEQEVQSKDPGGAALRDRNDDGTAGIWLQRWGVLIATNGRLYSERYRTLASCCSTSILLREIGGRKNPRSPLKDASTWFFCTSFPESRVKMAVLSSRLAQLCILDALYLLATRHREQLWDVAQVNTELDRMLRYKTR